MWRTFAAQIRIRNPTAHVACRLGSYTWVGTGKKESSVPNESSASSQTFASYLARNYVAKKGFRTGTVPEANELAAASDIVLTRADGMNFHVISIVDRESHPGKQFTLSRDKVQEIGKQCLKYGGKVNRAQLPITMQIMEIGPGSATAADLKRLHALKRPSMSRRS